MVLVTRAIERVKQTNLFHKETKTTAENIHEQQRATQIYILIFTMALCSLLAYNAIIYITNTVTVFKPSLEQYRQLQAMYDTDAVDCPCSHVSITYASFVDFECGFHPVCKSEFLGEPYLQQLFRIYQQLDVKDAARNAFTLRGTLFSHYQALRILCDLAQDAVRDARQQYLASSIIAASVIEHGRFTKQIDASLARFEATLSEEFSSNLKLVRGMVQGNAFVSLYSTNWYPVLHNSFDWATVYQHPQDYGNCSCLASAFCTQPSVPPIQGYLVGCTPLEALLQSSIECLYERTCLDLVTEHLNLSIPSPRPLNANQTRFYPRDTMEFVAQKMFIETCSPNVSYDRFFEQCRPLSCSVTLVERNGLLTIVTVFFGLFGGLTTSLKLLIPFVVFSAYKIIRKRKRTGQVTVQSRQSDSSS